MNIGMIGYFNPYEIKDFFPDNITIPSINLTASSVNATVRGLLQEGHYVRIFTSYPYNGLPQYIKGNNVEVHFISETSNIKGSSIFKRVYMINRLKKEIENNLQGLDVLHAQWTYEFALAAKHFSHKIPVFCSVRDWCPYIYSLAKGIRERLYWLISLCIFRKVMKGNDIHFIANSEYTLKQILSLYPDKNVSIIANPIIKENILLNKKTERKEQIFVSIAQSLDEPRKNIETLLKAFKQYKSNKDNTRLILIGHYSLNTYERWQAMDLLENVTFTGSLDRQQYYKILDESTVLIHPSIEETFGNILLEGMARCLPCIGGKRSGAVPMVLGNGKYGVLCDVNNIDSVVEAMRKIEDKDFIKELTIRCTEYLLNNYSNNIIAQKHVEVYKKNILCIL